MKHQSKFRARALHCLATGVFLALAWHMPAHAQFDMTHGGPVDVTAASGLDYDQTAMTLTARGNARAVRGNVTVLADRLVAHLRKKTPQTGAAAAPVAAPATTTGKKGAPDATDTGSDEIYRLEAFGHVQIFTPTDHVQGADHAVHDMDQAVLVLTGPNMVLTTPNETMTARDSMEYWSQRHMAVGRGDATITTHDGRKIWGDTLVGYTKPDDQPAGLGQSAPDQKGDAAKSDTQKGDASKNKNAIAASPDNAGGKLQRVEAYGHVIIRTQTETITGDRGVYLPDTGIARMFGHVHITRSQNQLDGQEGVMDDHAGLAELRHNDDDQHIKNGQVSGLLMPSDQASRIVAGKQAKSDDKAKDKQKAAQ